MIRQTSIPTSPAMYRVARPNRAMTGRSTLVDCCTHTMFRLRTEPTCHATDNVLAIGDQVQIERRGDAEPGFLEEDDGISENGIPAEDLRGPYDAVLRIEISHVIYPLPHPSLTISVRLALVPLKHSKYPAPAVSACSILVTCTIYAIVLSTACSSWSPCARSRRSDARAWAYWPRRTAFHGDSGAKYAPRASGRGQTHCSMKGS